MQERIKELRVNIDGLYQLTKELKPITGLEEQIVIGSNIVWDKKAPRNSKQIDDATHSLIYAKAWLGKVLGELGAENPYKSGYKTAADIEPTQDVADKIIVKYPDSLLCEQDPKNGSEPKSRQPSHIEKVDWLRTEIEKAVNSIKNLGRTTEMSFTKEFNIARTNAYNHLCEARFALGFELERIKLQEKDVNNTVQENYEKEQGYKL